MSKVTFYIKGLIFALILWIFEKGYTSNNYLYFLTLKVKWKAWKRDECRDVRESAKIEKGCIINNVAKNDSECYYDDEEMVSLQGCLCGKVILEK